MIWVMDSWHRLQSLVLSTVPIVQWGFVIVDTVCELPITYKSWSVGVGTFYTAATNQTRATSINPTLTTVKLVANYNEGPANGYYLCVGK